METTMRTTITATIALSLLLAVLGGCGSGPVSYVSDEVDFGFIRTVAVAPFSNLSADRFAAERLESVFLAELLTYDGLRVVDTGEVRKAWNDLRLGDPDELTPEQLKAVGERLGVDAVFTGAVQEYGLERLGGNGTYSVTVVFGMLETVTGSRIWNAQVQTDGSSFWRSLFGGQPASQYDVSRKAVRQGLDTLLSGGGDDGGDDRRDSSRRG